jgi:hypothetical protein
MKVLGSSPSRPPVFNSPLLFSFLPKLCKSSYIVTDKGNIFGAFPGGLSVIASDGTLPGSIETG